MYANNIGTVVRIMMLSCHSDEKGKKRKEKEKERGLIFHRYIHSKKKGGGTERGVYMYTNKEGIFVYSVTIPFPFSLSFFLELNFRDFI